MTELLSAKVVIEEEEPRLRTIQGVPTSNLAAIGVAEKGPVGEATIITSWDEYLRVYGGYTANAFDLPAAIEGFFENGGQRAYINRTVHYSDITNANSKTSAKATHTFLSAALVATAAIVLGSVVEPFSLVDGDTLEIEVDGGVADIATFNAAPAVNTAVNTETYALADGQTLTVEIDGGATQTVTFLTGSFVAIGAATAAEVAAVMNASLTGCQVDVNAGAPRITSDSQGTGSSVAVTGGTAAATLGFPASVSGTGDAADASAVTVAELKTLIEGDVSGVVVTDVGGAVQIATSTAGPTKTLQVLATSTMDGKLGLDNAVHTGTGAGSVNTLQVDGKYDGAYGNNLTIEIGAATNGESDHFNLIVRESGVLAEIWPNLNMDPTSTQYVETIINDANIGSTLIDVTDLDASDVYANNRPANATAAMAGGDDGLTGLADDDFVGSSVSKTGLRAFDLVNNAQLLIVPGRATATVHNAMLTYCAVIRDKSMFAILDPVANQGATAIVTYVKTTALLKNTQDGEFGAIYWPRIKVDNPNKTLFGNTTTVVVPPSGHIAGCYARIDNQTPGGVYEAPAGIEVAQIRGARGVEVEEVNEEGKRDLVYPELINPITALEEDPGVIIDGARTLKDTGNFPTIGERRGVIFVETSIRLGSKFAKFRKIKPSTRRRLERNANSFLVTQTRNDAFASDDPKLAFFVDFTDALNPPSFAFARKIVGRIGLATAKPAEFIIIRVSQDTRALDAEVAQALAA